MRTDRIRLVVVGCGDIAETRHIPCILDNSDVELIAVCDRDEVRARTVAESFGIANWSTDYKALLADDRVDAAVVATPPWVTPEITIDFLRAGKHVLCEKPMALSLEQARQVAETEQATGKGVQVGFTYRHDPLLEKLRDWIREGKLGSPVYFRLGIFDEIWDPSGNPEHYDRIFNTMEHGIPSIHDGAHIADFLHFLTDSPIREVQAFGFKSREEFPSSNYDTSIVDFENGDRARIEICWFYPHFPYGEFEAVGPNGLAVFDRYKRFVELRTTTEQDRMEHKADWWVTCFELQLRKFVAGVAAGGPFVPGTKEGIYSLALTKAIETAVNRVNK